MNQTMQINNNQGGIKNPVYQQRREFILSSIATYKKKNGTLSFSIKEKMLAWKCLSDSTIVLIPTDHIVETKKETKPDKTELLYIKKVDMDKGIVFCFSEGKFIYLEY